MPLVFGGIICESVYILRRFADNKRPRRPSRRSMLGHRLASVKPIAWGAWTALSPASKSPQRRVPSFTPRALKSPRSGRCGFFRPEEFFGSGLAVSSRRHGRVWCVRFGLIPVTGGGELQRAAEFGIGFKPSAALVFAEADGDFQRFIKADRNHCRKNRYASVKAPCINGNQPVSGNTLSVDGNPQLNPNESSNP